MGIRAEIKEAILEGHLYDFVSDNQHRLSKSELVDLVKNVDYAAWQKTNCFCEPNAEYKQFCEKVIENLNDIEFFEDEDQ